MNNSVYEQSDGLKRRVLERVWRVWFWKRAAPLLVIEAGVALGVFVAVFSQISPRVILLNAIGASDGLRSFVQFFIDNLFVKSIQSRLLLVLWLGFVVYVWRDVLVVFRRYSAVRVGSAIIPSVIRYRP